MGNPLIDPVIELNHCRNPDGGRATTIIGGMFTGATAFQASMADIFLNYSSQSFSSFDELFIATPSGPGYNRFRKYSWQAVMI